MPLALIWLAAKQAVGSLPWQAWAVLAAVVILLGAGWSLHRAGVAEGSATTRQEITDANRASETRAQGAGEKVSRCYGSGGTWDRAHGLCDHGAGR